MLDLNTIFIYSEIPKDLAEFYKKVLQVESDWDDHGYTGFKTPSSMLIIGPHDKVHGKNQNPERIILNFETDDVKGEFDRVKAVGATIIKEPYKPDEAQEMWIATLADPDGNYFQLVNPMK